MSKSKTTFFKPWHALGRCLEKARARDVQKLFGLFPKMPVAANTPVSTHASVASRYVGRKVAATQCGRRGYVLVVTLGLLVLAATLLVAVGRTAMQHALAARFAADDLQTRWGVESCHKAVLPFAESILNTVEGRRNAATPVYRTSVRLGGKTFLLIISDEQAKASVNSIVQDTDQSTAENRIRQGLGGSGLGNAVRLHIAPLAARAPETKVSTTQPAGVRGWITGFGQVFENVSPDRLIGSGPGSPIDRLTCWGNGTINIHRTLPDALSLAAADLTRLQVSRLLDARNNSEFSTSSTPRGKRTPLLGASPNTPAPKLDEIGQLFADAGLDPGKRGSVGFVTKSTCHSLWVLARDGRRDWYELTISDETDPRGVRIERFVW